MAKGKSNPTATPPATATAGRDDLRGVTRMLFQGWVSVAVWMSIGLFLEGLLGYKIPAYLADQDRRELFRLAHTHGTFLGLVVIAAALCARWAGVAVARAARRALRVGAVLMPAGFFLAGVWHPEGDPGPAIWVVPPSALLLVFGVLSVAFSCYKRPSAD